MAGELANWKPFRELERMRREMDHLWDSFLEERPPRKEELMREWVPSLDLSETKDEFLVKAEIPGTDPKNINLSLNDGMLTINGEKKQEKEEKDENHHFIERSYGSFTRTIRLPGQVQGDKVRASYKDGVLKVVLPKSEETKKKEIQIKVE